MTIKGTIEGAENVFGALQHVADNFMREIPMSLDQAADLTQSIMKQEAPRASGSLANSITISKKSTRESSIATIGPIDADFGGKNAGLAIEYGRTPGTTPPPYGALVNRYGLSYGKAKAIARLIGGRGIGPNPFVSRTYNRIRSNFLEFGIRAMVNSVRSY